MKSRASRSDAKRDSRETDLPKHGTPVLLSGDGLLGAYQVGIWLVSTQTLLASAADFSARHPL